MKTHHPPIPATTMKCKDCGKLINTNKMNEHIRQHVEDSYKFTCPYSDCDRVFQGQSDTFKVRCVSLLTQHRRTHHHGEHQLQSVDTNATTTSEDFSPPSFDEHLGEPEEDDYVDAQEDDGEEKNKFEKKFWAVWLETEFCHLLPETLVTNMISALSKLATWSSSNLRRKLKNALSGNEAIIEAAFENEDWMTECFLSPSLHSTYSRKSMANRFANVIEPQVNTTFPVLKSSITSAIYQVSLEDTILTLLDANNWDPDNNEGFLPEMDYVTNLRGSGFNVHAGYKGSTRYKEVEATVQPHEKPAIHLQLYADELDRDMMGSSSGRHKIHVVYVKILNLTDGQCRTSEDYHLLQIMPNQTLKANDYENVMRPLVADVSSVVEQGIEYKGRRFGVRLATLQGDGLERAAMFGMASNFSTLSHCDPLSYLTTKTRLKCQSVQDILNEAQQGRTRDTYDEDLLHLHERERKKRRMRASRDMSEETEALKAKYEYSRGMKYESPFHKISHFHVTDKGAIVYCIAHDLYSGAFRSDMARVLISLSNAGHYTWTDIQDKFRTYRLSLRGDDRQGWYDIICSKPTFKQLPGNHSSNHLVIRFLSSIWINRSEGDQMFQTTAWALYLSMKQICELVSSKVVTEENRLKLKDAVQDYLEVINFMLY